MALQRLLVATRKGLFVVEPPDYAIPAPVFLGVPVTNVLSDTRDGALYAALNHGHYGVKLHRSRDGAATWEELPAPAYPVNAEQPVSTALLWCLAAGGADQPGRLWCGTIPGGLFRSDDHGASWQLVQSLWDRPERAEWFGGGYDHPGIHSICVDPRDSRRVAVAVSCGGVWLSENDGATWEPRNRGLRAEYMPPERQEDGATQDPHRIVQCHAAPQLFWMQHHNAVFRSVDGLDSWQEVAMPVSRYGFAVAVHPQDGERAWFVPMLSDEFRVPPESRLAVSDTADGGASFTVRTNGLPPPPAYDLVYRHGLAVDDSGRRLAMGSTTGGLWLSEDEGANWRLLSAHLPPISAVAFA
jgi:hypothetical protein